MVKVEFIIVRFPMRPYGRFELMTNFKVMQISIANKLLNKIVELPYVPTMNMEIDLSSFNDVYRFSSDELDYLKDDNFFKIERLILQKTHLIVCLTLG